MSNSQYDKARDRSRYKKVKIKPRLTTKEVIDMLPILVTSEKDLSRPSSNNYIMHTLEHNNVLYSQGLTKEMSRRSGDVRLRWLKDILNSGEFIVISKEEVW